LKTKRFCKFTCPSGQINGEFGKKMWAICGCNNFGCNWISRGYVVDFSNVYCIKNVAAPTPIPLIPSMETQYEIEPGLELRSLTIVDHKECPTLETDENTKKIICRKANCRKTCKPGSSLVGKKVVRCIKSRNGARWSKPIGKCSRCGDNNPTANDSSYGTEITYIVWFETYVFFACLSNPIGIAWAVIAIFSYVWPNF